MDLSSIPVETPRRMCVFSFVYFPRYVGGAEIAVHEIVSRIERRDIACTLITLRIDKELPAQEMIGNIEVHRIGFTSSLRLNKILYPILALIKALRLHMQKPFDVQWAIMANYSGFAGVLFKYCVPKVPFILTLQEGDPIAWTLRRVRYVMFLFRKIFTKADHVQAISHYLGDFAKDMGAKSVSVVPNGVDVAYFSHMFPQSELDALYTTFERKKEHEKFIITTSRLVHKNGIDRVIKALPYVTTPVRFIVVGSGPDEMMLKNLAQGEGVADKVVFVGYVPHEDLRKYLRIADIFIRPSRSEGFGNSFVEAMAVGVPVIATSVGGIPDFVTDQKTGLFCDGDDPQDIAQKIDLLCNKVFLAKEIVAEAKKMVKEKYDWDLISKEMKKIFMAHV